MVQSSEVVALLPMKAHSARVKSKNFREFAGKPLFRWILDTLLSIEEIDRVVINTDARQILSDHGLNDGDAGGRVMLRDRKPEICGDLVSMNLVLADDVENVDADTYVMTHTTNPLLSADAIRAALGRYREVAADGRADSLFTVNRIQTRFYRDDMTPVNHDPDNLIRTQDLEPWFEENSNLYIFNRQSFAKTGARIGARPAMHETPPLESIDIDNADQWMLAEAVALYDRKVEL
ncbi:acylneuraminate cytidylyltransferase family protein [Hyphobacterium sp.]|uniref:acylneuraminate cytidylyltransferase family protein n=1 Tax=Hyphobacterium sp. TaxID=2004662 RepID=UPI003BAC2D2F